MSTPPGSRGEGRRDPETGGRPLADILREAGVESPTRGRRRRGEELEDTGVRQRGSGDTGRVADRPEFGRRSSDRAGDRAGSRPGDRVREKIEGADAPAPERRVGRRQPEPSTAAIPGLRPSRKPDVPAAAGATREGTAREGSVRERAPRARTAGADPGPRTGPIPVVRTDDPPLLDEGVGPGEGALAWLRFIGELVLALAAGVGTYFLFTVLWQQLPYVAVLLAPVAVAGLVGGVSAWRQRQDREPAGARLVAVLVFAGTLLTIAPAAGLLSTA
ncbi:hypothetical protein SAMN05660642_00660 [Geodermatophilus siccatus]|uniref:Uncharacterized protein n=1 Tax=Geodermatophilus siccatus TaxID=1137991 RepID=A0A1G9LZT9_9ACTN|nr:hypothetical protein [Geodermatophilus siccatus]SDL67542.1 hypothetical protein SAMN05660642_00660 [Geodermatophilus siccatus]